MTSPTPSPISDQAAKLARRTLWLAFVWNDHNFDAAHTEALNACKALGINSFDEANEFIESMESALSTAPTTGSAPEEFDAQAAAVKATQMAAQTWAEKHDPAHAHAYSYERCGLEATPVDAKLAAPPAKATVASLTDSVIQAAIERVFTVEEGRNMGLSLRLFAHRIAASMGGDRK